MLSPTGLIQNGLTFEVQEKWARHLRQWEISYFLLTTDTHMGKVIEEYTFLFTVSVYFPSSSALARYPQDFLSGAHHEGIDLNVVRGSPELPTLDT